MKIRGCYGDMKVSYFSMCSYEAALLKNALAVARIPNDSVASFTQPLQSPIFSLHVALLVSNIAIDRSWPFPAGVKKGQLNEDKVPNTGTEKRI